MEHYQTLQNLNPHTITMALLQCAAVLAALTAGAIALFRAF